MQDVAAQGGKLEGIADEIGRNVDGVPFSQSQAPMTGPGFVPIMSVFGSGLGGFSLGPGNTQVPGSAHLDGISRPGEQDPDVMADKGTLYIVSAPSGAGKTSLVAALVEKLPRLKISISHTTRARREGEVDGQNYHFIERRDFVRLVEEGRFLEHAEVFGNLYGTSADGVAETLRGGEDVILEIDWQGASQVRHVTPEAVSIFILPPCLKTLAKRLRSRASDDEAVIQRRLDGAREEMSHYGEFDYLVVNDNFEQALDELAAIVVANRLTTDRQAVRQAAALADLLSGPETQ